ncbi:hypothetical protein U0070_015485 [Myodes glareolus]|uniref:Protein Spindly n=1 Tax=Myodes glareolus TaxID=447135 RepID=A0AAW0HJR7_MYOGA
MEREITDLQNKLKECEKERSKAAQYGLQLLERQTGLQSQLGKCHEEMMIVTEGNNQEKYALQREAELKNRMLESLSCDCEALKQQKTQPEQLEMQLNRSHRQEVNDQKNKLEKLKVELEEVDDRRVARERQLNSVKVKYQSLKKHNAFTRKQMNKIQLQISTLLRMWGSQTELEQQERLFTILEQKNGEIQHLLGEIKNLEKFNTLYESMESKPSTSASPCSLEDSTYYADLLQLKLGKLNKESTKGEQRMKAMFESRALDIERKLFVNERHLQLSERENIKPRAKLDESKLKYEPKPEKTEAPVLRKRREVLPSDVTAPEETPAASTIREVSRLPLQREERVLPQ